MNQQLDTRNCTLLLFSQLVLLLHLLLSVSYIGQRRQLRQQLFATIVSGFAVPTTSDHASALVSLLPSYYQTHEVNAHAFI